MAQDVLVTPPIRQSLEDVNSAQANGIAQPMTEKSWYLYWQRLGQMANQQSSMITYGTHANRPDPGVMPDGALYVETDRGMIYEKINGQWTYLAGTMWGTLSPDQRPTDLGANDAGFTFHGTDYPREFVWNGTVWIEATPVRWGMHAGRLALVLADVIDGELFVEADRGDVMYQNQGGAWRYIGGTMYGTVSPTDQRPTDLGSQDAGFDFRTTTKPAHEFVWSGTAWIEVGADYSVNGTLIGTRPALNLIAGSNVTISGADNAGSDRVDVTVSSSGGGSGGAVSSVFTRTGAVVAATGDYTAAQVTNAVDQTGAYANPTWITSLAWSKITGAPAAGVSSVFGRTGAVVAATGDYTAAQVTGAVGGSAGLTHANVHTKVGTSGQIVEGGITDSSPANSGSLTITAGGNVGIGTASAHEPLEVFNASATAVDAIFGNSSGAISLITSSNVGGIQGYTSTAAASTSNICVQPSGGNVGIGATSASTLVALGTSAAPIKLALYDGGGSQIYGMGIHLNGLVTFGAGINGASGVPQMVLSNSGGLGLGLGTGVIPTYVLQLATDSAAKPSTNTWTIASDIRVKQNVRPLEGGLDVINRLEPIVSEYNGKAGTPRDGRVVSLDPAKLREILPHAVSSVRRKLDPADAEETDVLGVNTHEILYHLVLAVQQLSKK